MSKETEAIERIQKGLGCSVEEAREIYAYDREVEKTTGGLEHDLSADKVKVAQTFTKTGTRKAPTAYKFTKRERKPNEVKASIIDYFSSILRGETPFDVENVEILNKERQISFEIGGEKFELTLVQKRKAKN